MNFRKSVNKNKGATRYWVDIFPKINFIISSHLLLSGFPTKILYHVLSLVSILHTHPVPTWCNFVNNYIQKDILSLQPTTSLSLDMEIYIQSLTAGWPLTSVKPTSLYPGESHCKVNGPNSKYESGCAKKNLRPRKK